MVMCLHFPEESPTPPSKPAVAKRLPQVPVFAEDEAAVKAKKAKRGPGPVQLKLQF